jgi:sugar phosphate isomerase/epimerase
MERKAIALLGKAGRFWKGAWHKRILYRDAREPIGVQRPDTSEIKASNHPIVGANLDPSHLFWMGADPLAAIDALGDAIHHVHAKDTYLNDRVLNLTGRLETIGHEKVKERAWSYITLGIGHGEQWWRQFCYRLRLNGYDGWLSIEHEDIILADGGNAAIGRSAEECFGRRAKRLRVAGDLKKVGIRAKVQHPTARSSV